MSRPVNIAVTSFKPYESKTVRGNVENGCKLCDRAALAGADIFCLPEAFPVAVDGTRMKHLEFVRKHGATVLKTFSQKAKEHAMYILCSSYELEKDKLYNTVFIFDRKGKMAGKYRKVHPTAGELANGISPSYEFPVFDADFGKFGIMICFDVYYPEVAANLVKNGAELIFFSSAFEAGMMLNACAWNNRVFIASSVRHGAPKVIDPQGHIVREKSASELEPVLFATIELDTVFFSTDGHIRRIAAIKKKYGKEVNIDVRWPEENFFLSSLSRKRTALDIASEFDLEPLDIYLEKSSRLRDESPEKAAAYTKRIYKK